jgi:hypothetical protein
MAKIKKYEDLELIEEANEFIPVDDLKSDNKQDAIVEVYENSVKSDVVNRIEIVTEYPTKEEVGVLYIKVV